MAIYIDQKLQELYNTVTQNIFVDFGDTKLYFVNKKSLSKYDNHDDEKINDYRELQNLINEHCELDVTIRKIVYRSNRTEIITTTTIDNDKVHWFVKTDEYGIFYSKPEEEEEE